MESPAGQLDVSNVRPTLSRIRFPTDSSSADKSSKGGQGQVGMNQPDGSGFKSRPLPYLSPSSMENSRPSELSNESNRRRVRSVNTASVLSHASPTRSRIASAAAAASGNGRGGAHRRVVSHHSSRAGAGTSLQQRMTSLDSSLMYSSQSTATHEDSDDPNIIADLQRALKFKTDVEDRIKAAKAGSDPSGTSPSPSSTAAPSPKPYLYKSPNSPYGTDRPGRFDQDLVDFSPSVAKQSLHPVPTSSNDGATLDWSTPHRDDEKREKRWSMSLSRRMSRDKSSLISGKALLEQQEILFIEKISRIRKRAHAQTLRKAEMTAGQLSRRYASLKPSPNGKPRPNLTDVVRWFNSLEPSLREIMDEAEPLTWLRHLHRDSHGLSSRSSWVVTALIMEEYLKAYSGKGVAALVAQEPSPLDVSSDRGSTQSQGLPVQVALVRSRPTSVQSLDTHPYGRHASDTVITFEPITTSRRSSAGAESRNSFEIGMSRWKSAIPRASDSPRSSMHGGIHEDRASSLLSMSPVAKRKGTSGFSAGRTEDESSSAVESSREDGNGTTSRGIIRYSLDRDEHPSRHQRPFSMPGALQPPLMPKIVTDLNEDAGRPRQSKSSTLPVGNTSGDKNRRPEPTRQHSHTTLSLSGIDTLPQRWLRRSSPSSVPASVKAGKSTGQRAEAKDHALALEYNSKRETLETLKSQNLRIKHILLTASKGIAEYDELQKALSERLNLPYPPLSNDVLEAFSHDPSAVTGNTRSLQGWRAVEDIHRRSTLQRQILTEFARALPCVVSSVNPPDDGIYEDTLSALTSLLGKLESQSQSVHSRVQELSDVLIRVKELRDQLKPEYENTGKQTSGTYPELVQLEAHLDRFVNQRNRLWMVAETSISLALSSIAPFMKTFGRPIWNDLHDFLVIPWYRNDFSGEEYWYPVTFPKRTSRHWLKLTLFIVMTPLCLKNGTRLLVNLLTQGYSIQIPFAIPSIVIYALYLFTLLFLMSVLVGLFFMVLAQAAIIVWWSAWALRIVQ